MEDDLNILSKRKTTSIICFNEDDINFFKVVDNLNKIMQTKKIKGKNNDCGTAPGNLVDLNITSFVERLPF